MLDTNIVSHLIRNPNGRVRDRIAALGETAVCTSLVVAAEVRFGCEKRGSRRLTRQAEAVLGSLTVLPLESPVEREYSVIRKDLEARGMPIGPNDLFIAAHARALGLTLVTENRNEFGRVPGLEVENWLAE